MNIPKQGERYPLPWGHEVKLLPCRIVKNGEFYGVAYPHVITRTWIRRVFDFVFGTALDSGTYTERAYVTTPHLWLDECPPARSIDEPTFTAT